MKKIISFKIFLLGLILLFPILFIINSHSKNSQVLAQTSTFRFVSWADTKDGAPNLAPLSNQVATFNPVFTLYPGDVVPDNISTSLLNTWKNAINGGSTPGNGLFTKTFPTRGNHDFTSTTPWEDFFDISSTVSSIGGSNYRVFETDRTYSFDYGNSHFVGIDVNGDARYMSAGQISWLDADLTLAESRGLTHAFLFFHGPIYPLAEHCCTNATTALITVLNKHTIISATFHGHEHTLAYTHIDSSRISTVTHPFEEFVTANAGVNHTYDCTADRFDYCMTVNCPKDSSGYCSPAIHGFTVVDVSGDSYTVRAYQKGASAAVLKQTWTFSKSGQISPVPTSAPTPTPTQAPTPTPTSIPGQTITLNPQADTYVDNTYPTTNYGSAITLGVDGSPIKKAFMKFDLSSLAGKAINSAKLRLYVTNPAVNAHAIKDTDSSWTETSINYNAMPSLGNIQGTVPVTGSTGNVWVEANLTSFISSKVGSIVSLGIDPVGTDGLEFNSKENSANKPELVIQLTSGSVTPTITLTPTQIPTPTTIPVTPTPACNPVSSDLGVVNYTFDNGSATTNYRVWSRMMASDSARSYYLQVDNNCPINVEVFSGQPVNTWQWVDYKDASSTNKLNISLTPGNHTFKLIGKEAGLKLDKIILTEVDGNNDTCVPTEFGSNCSTNPTAVPTPTIVPTPTTNPTIIPSPTVIPTITQTPTSVPTIIPTITSIPTDTTPPTIRLTSPENNAIFKRGQKITFAAEATDDIGILKVEYKQRGEATIFCKSTQAPYTCIFNSTKLGFGVTTIWATAFDNSGNTTTVETNITIK